MKSLSEILNEHFVNIFTKEDTKDHLKKYGGEVWDILQKSYEKIGGLLGINDLQQLVDDTDFWKLCTKGGKVVACALYSFKRGGRKLICGGTDGTDEGKKWFYKILEDDVKFTNRQAWAEVSDAMEHILIKKLGGIPVPNTVAELIMRGKKFTDLNPDGYHYTREIGGESHEKILVANPDGFPKEYQTKVR